MMTDVEIVKVLTETEQRSKSNSHRIDAIEKSQEAINNLASSVAVMAKEQEHMRSDIMETAGDVKDVKTTLASMPTGTEHKELLNEIKELKDKPGKRWESIVEKAILVLVGALVSFALSKIGLV